jgi:peptide/nickel transport system ATP-binding protein
VRDVVQHPHHPYTPGLMGSIPTLDAQTDRLTQIPGAMPGLDAIPRGCAFNPRCPYAFDRCRSERPERAKVGHSEVACWLMSTGRAEGNP